MEHLDSLTLAHPDQPTCLTIGAFDGVHRGHQRVIERLLATADRYRYRTAALTFFPLPRQVLGTSRTHFYLTAPKERARLLHEMGIELVITHPFDEQVRAMRAADFVELLVERLNVKEIWVGEDFALGYQREGDLPFLQAQGKIWGFVVRTVDFFAIEETAVSSSLIRRVLEEGRVRDASEYLGRPFKLPGRVVEGAGRGRQIGFPTANLQIWDEQALPARGVYAAFALVGSSSYPAAVNIGLRPTLTAGGQTAIEAHLVDFAGDLYGMEITLDFIARLRDEKKFSNLEQLVAQVQEDVARARRLLGSQIGSELAGA